MAGARDMLLLIPPILTGQLAISSPARALSTARIWGNDDPTIGTVGWTPPIDGAPFAVISVQSVKATEKETFRLWLDYQIQIFVGVAQSDEAGALFNYNDQAMQWMDAFVQVIANNRRLYPGSTVVSATVGDVEWCYESATLRIRHEIYNRNYFGVEFKTNLHVVESVNWQ